MKMTVHKESSPESSTSASSSFRYSSTGTGNSEDRSSSSPDRLHLEVPLDHTNSVSTSQSSPRPSGRGSSSNSSLSFGQISYRDLSDIQDEFKIMKTLHDGSFSKVLLARQEDTTKETTTGSGGSGSRGGPNNKYLALKAIPSGGLFTEDFKRELRYNYFLSPHPHIVTSFNVSFNWASCFNVYVQEYAPFGDLSRFINRKSLALTASTTSSSSASSPLSASAAASLCLPECQVRVIANQIASALEFMHSFKLVHQDLRAENVLVFKSNLSRVKLSDFGSTRREGTLVTKGNLISSSSSSLLPPELSYLLPQERYECQRASDVWQMGVFLCVCLTGSVPWQMADFADSNFRQYTNWIKRKSLKVPEPFRRFTPRLVRLLKRLLEPKSHLRSEVREVFKYLGDDWIKPSYRMSVCVNTVPASNSTKIMQKNCSPKKSDNVSKLKRIRKNIPAALVAESAANENDVSIKQLCSKGELSGQVPIVNVIDTEQEDKDSLVKSWVGEWVACSTVAVAQATIHNHHRDDAHLENND